MEILLLWVILALTTACLASMFFRGANGHNEKLWRDQSALNSSVLDSLEALEERR